MASFTPDANFSPQSNPKDWAYHLGCMPQGAHVVFTKAGLVDFLKTHGIDVGPNFTELSRVPKYATVGRFDKDPASVGAAPAPAAAPVAAAAAAPAPVAAPAPAVEPAPTQQQQVLTPDGDVFRPTRRVREPVGGGSAQIGAIFGGGDDNTDEAAKESARRRGLVPAPAPAPAPTTFPQDPAPSQPAPAAAPAFSADETTNTFRPTRRVREPGGTGGVSSITLG
ncbi:hypothetical protein FA10DRAFT_269064, partial [Acaromyces ingoldii]